MAISATFSASIEASDTRTNVGLPAASTKLGVSRSPSTVFTDGSAALMANLLYAGSRTLSGSSENLDLAGVLADLYGGTITAARVKGVYIKNLSSSANLTVGAAASNAWSTFLNGTGTATLPPGAWIVAATPDASGWSVTAGTGDILKVAGTTGESYEIALLMASS